MQLAHKLHKNCNQPTLWYVAMKNDAPPGVFVDVTPSNYR